MNNINNHKFTYLNLKKVAKTTVFLLLSIFALSFLPINGLLGINSADAVLPTPTAGLWLTPQGICSGDTAELSWSITGEISASITHVGSVALSGSTTVNPTQTTTYTLVADNLDGSNSVIARTLEVKSTWLCFIASPAPTPTPTPTTPPTPTPIPIPAPFSIPTAQLSVSPRSICSGESANLSWNTSNATNASISNFGSVILSGSANVTPSRTTTYTLIATNQSGGNAVVAVNVSVKSTWLCGPSDIVNDTTTPNSTNVANFNIQKLGRNITDNDPVFLNVVEAGQGDIVEFKISIRSRSNTTIRNLILTDIMPSGFVYQAGSTKINGGTTSDGIAGSSGLFLGNLRVGEERIITLLAILDKPELLSGITTVDNIARANSSQTGIKEARLPLVIEQTQAILPQVLGISTGTNVAFNYVLISSGVGILVIAIYAAQRLIVRYSKPRKDKFNFLI